MRIKIFGHYWHLGLAVSWVLEFLAAVMSCRIALQWSDLEGASNAICWLQAVVFGVCVVGSMVAMGLYNSRLRERLSGILLRLSIGVALGGLVAGGILGLLLPLRLPFLTLLAATALAWVVLLVVRIVTQSAVDEDIFKRRVLVYGAGPSAKRILELRRRSDQMGFRIVGFVRAGDEPQEVPVERLIESEGTLCELAQGLEIDEVVVAMYDRRHQFPLKGLLDCRLKGIEVTDLVTFLERETGKVYLDFLNPSWMIFGAGFRRDLIRRYSERIFDLLASAGLLVIASPVMLIAALAIKLEDGLRAPIFYKQARVGYAGRVFDVLKFRSMRADAEKDGKARWATANDDRVTRVGKFIRKARIDEMPQLLNVLRGQMSFVGPRPERPEFVASLAESIPYYLARHSVRPGITGWAQLCYAYGASEQDAVEKLQFDLYYVKNHDLVLDILILLQTIEVVLFGKGAR